MPSNLLAHHLKVLEEAGLISRHRSEGDRRRTYLRLVPARSTRSAAAGGADGAAGGVRVHRQLGPLAPGRGAVAAGQRGPRRLGRHPPGGRDRPRRDRRRRAPSAAAAPRAPRHIGDVRQDGDLVVTVCDLAREELGGLAAVHWSVPDPVPAGDPGSFDAALDDLGQRVGRLALRLVPPPRPQAPVRRGA